MEKKVSQIHRLQHLLAILVTACPLVVYFFVPGKDQRSVCGIPNHATWYVNYCCYVNAKNSDILEVYTLISC